VSQSVREHARHSLETECVLRAPDGRLLGDRVLDVSWSGARIEALADARVGERATLSLRVPGSQVWLDAEAEITRVVRGRRLGDAGVAYGLRLRRMDGMSRVLLGQIARGRPEVSSARGERRDYARTIARIHAE